MVYINPEDNLVQTPSAAEPVLLASLAHCLIQGIIFCQLVSFWHRRASDNFHLKLFVFTIFMLCLAQTIGQIYKVWIVTVSQKNWAESSARYIEFPLNCIICSSVQAFLVKRVWKVTGRRWIVLIPLAALLLIVFAAGVTMAITIDRFVHKSRVNGMVCHSVACLPEFSAWLWSSTALDATITTALSVYFVRSKTGFHHLDAVVTKIWNLTLVTAALPMASMLTAVSLFYATGGKHYDVVTAFIVIAGKLYFNGLLRNLNVRQDLKARLEANVLGRCSIATVGSANMRRNVAADNTLMDDIEKGIVDDELCHEQKSGNIQTTNIDIDQDDLFMRGSDDQKRRITPPPWSTRQIGSLSHSFTL